MAITVLYMYQLQFSLWGFFTVADVVALEAISSRGPLT